MQTLLLILGFVWLGHSGSVTLTHFWDCNGMGCDSSTLQPWNPSLYRAAPGYMPQDPKNHGGAKYGEQMWLVGAASDTLAHMMGGDDGCCGHDSDSGGCGQCALISVGNSINSGWKALVMKKSRCPPNSNGCENGKAHMDLAIPGFDNLQYSTANICGQSGTGMSKDQSGCMGNWYKKCSNTQQCINDCSQLPGNFKESCRLFSGWGWRVGNPTGTFEVVRCPQAFKDYIQSLFGPDGPHGGGPSPSPGPSPSSQCKWGDACLPYSQDCATGCPNQADCKWSWASNDSAGGPTGRCRCQSNPNTSCGTSPGPRPSGNYNWGDSCSTNHDQDCAQVQGCTDCRWSWPKNESSGGPDAKCRCKTQLSFSFKDYKKVLHRLPQAPAKRKKMLI